MSASSGSSYEDVRLVTPLVKSAGAEVPGGQTPDKPCVRRQDLSSRRMAAQTRRRYGVDLISHTPPRLSGSIATVSMTAGVGHARITQRITLSVGGMLISSWL